MTLTQLTQQVTSESKWFAVTSDQNEQQWLVYTKSRILKGTAKHSTIVKFFAKLGYKLNVEYKIEKNG
jgi:hypothetical protein